MTEEELALVLLDVGDPEAEQRAESEAIVAMEERARREAYEWRVKIAGARDAQRALFESRGERIRRRNAVLAEARRRASAG
jgi:hypothetical protein